MEQLFSQSINPNLDMEELQAMCTEFKNDYNQKHFVRNESFKAAAEGITGAAWGRVCVWGGGSVWV
jgi:magnesium-protoporphyrin IX monomethyl ester (oxidative) cyclase